MNFKIITTSWDDGHPLDFKIAELLSKYNLDGTFYIPERNSEHEVMKEEEILELSKRFEIGGHTLNHIRLNSAVENELEYEIMGCFTWLKQLLGYDPISFCFPGGVFTKDAIVCARSSGFKILRSTELFSTEINRSFNIMPTTIQVYEHSKFTYVRHLTKRLLFGKLFLWIKNNSITDILKLIDYYLERIQKDCGCLHIWGHSWEIEEMGLWKKLETILSHLAGYKDFEYLKNKQLLKYLN